MSELTFRNIINICEMFANHHYSWPNENTTREEFEAAGMRTPKFDGASLAAALRTPGKIIQEDEEYQRLARRLARDGIPAVSLCHLTLNERRKVDLQTLRELVSSAFVHMGKAQGRPDGTLYLQTHYQVLERAFSQAGIDRKDAPFKSLYATVTVPISKAVLDCAGEMIYGNNMGDMDRNYYLSLTENNRLHICYNAISGSRFIGALSDDDVAAMQESLAASIRKAACGLGCGAQESVTAAPRLQTTLQKEISLLRAGDGRIHLPDEHLSTYSKIKDLLQKAGGRYVGHQQAFVFDDGIDCAEVLAAMIDGRPINYKKDFQFFATSRDEAIPLCQFAGDLVGRRVLEPSAGDGALADVAREMGAEVITIEKWDVNAKKLRAKGFEPIERDFLQVTPEEIGLFDAIIANPPFAKNQDIMHVRHMLDFLKPGGSLSVIMSTGWQEGRQRAHRDFIELLEGQEVEITPIEAGAFAEAGTMVPTLRLGIRNYRPEPKLADQATVDPAAPRRRSMGRG